jgi:hypothetical protein
MVHPVGEAEALEELRDRFGRSSFDFPSTRRGASMTFCVAVMWGKRLKD